jgi:hypothetical protein
MYIENLSADSARFVAEREAERPLIERFASWRIANRVALQERHSFDARLLKPSRRSLTERKLLVDWEEFERVRHGVSPPVDSLLPPVVVSESWDDDLDAMLSEPAAAETSQLSASLGSGSTEHDVNAKPSLPEDYAFPLLPQTAALPALDSELRVELTSLSDSKEGYESIRERVCAINLEMNRRGKLPPAFRRSRTSRPEAQTTDEVVVTRDRMVIDLHWLYERGYRARLADSRFGDLMTAHAFPFAAAEDFVSRKWKTEIRAGKIMGLSEFDQLQLAVLVTKDVRDKRKAVIEKSRKVATSLRQKSQTGAKLHSDDIDDFVCLWIADELCAGGSQTYVAQLHAWQRGSCPLAKQTISPKLRRMRRWTGSSTAKASTVPVESV